MRRRDFLKTLVGGAAAAVLPLPVPDGARWVDVGGVKLKIRPVRYAYYAHYLENGIPRGADVKAIWLDNKKVWP